MKRRAFIRNIGVSTVSGILGGLNLTAVQSGLLQNLVDSDSDRVLVLIELNGGNDGLNTFVPLDAYDNLANVRSSVVIPQNQLVDFTDTISIHPSMPRVRDLYDNGKLTLVQNVGYPNQNRSHFRSLDIWNTAVDSDTYANTGWIGRYLDDEFPAYPANFPNSDCTDPFAITMGSSIINCQGVDANFSHSILNVNNVAGLTAGIEVAQSNDCYGEEMLFLTDAFKKSNDYSDRVVAASDAGVNAYSGYPDTFLGEQLRTVARLIDGGLQTRIYVVKLKGFDLHDNQVEEGDHATGAHADLLANLSESVFAFQEDLKGLGLEERVVGMTYSEFGRKIISNAGNGTDHGTAAPMILFGSCLISGVVGENPIIAADVSEEEGIAMQYDFRSIYGSILMDWFKVPIEKVQTLLTEDFTYIPLIEECLPVVEENEPADHLPDLATYLQETAELFNVKAYPSPFEYHISVAFQLKKAGQVRLDMYDVLGKQIKQILNSSFQSGSHKVLVEGHNLTAGIYFIRIQAGSTVKSIRVTKV